MQTDSTSGTEPLFVMVADRIERLLADLEGAPLPSERDLAREFGVNRATIRRAVAKLYAEGRLFRRAAGDRRLVCSPDLASTTVAVCIPLAEYDYASAGSKVDWGSEDLMGANHLPIHMGVSNCLRDAEAGGSVWLDLDQELIGPNVSHDRLGHLLRSRNVSGVIYWPVLPVPNEVLSQLRTIQSRMPLVLLDRLVWGFEADNCRLDCLKGGLMMGRHLMERGHRRFAFIGNALPDFVHNYFLGLETALSEDGLHIPTENALFIRNESLDLDCVLGPMLARPPESRPTALVCANDTLARMALGWLSSRGLSAPADLAVVGGGDCNPVACELLGLTTLHLSYQELGRAAAQLLLERISLPVRSAPSLTRLVDPALVVRRSCGA